MVRVGMVGLGKMGISHQAILNSTEGIDLVAACDSTPLLASIMGRYTKIKSYSNYTEMLEKEALDAVVIATPPKAHVAMVAAAIDKGLAIFCEKPFVLETADGITLAAAAKAAGIVNQVGYHYRFVGSFVHVKSLVDAGILGRIHHVTAEAYGPVVLRPKTGSWRGRKQTGGGALYDYATHALDLLNYCIGRPDTVLSASLGSIFSEEVDDEVYALMCYNDGKTAVLQVNWSDESYRKMSTKLTISGTNGKIIADRQEVQIYMREARSDLGLNQGWNVRYTTELTEPVDYYLRGEEYSAQIEHFAKHIEANDPNTRSTFATAVEADMTVDAIRNAASRPGIGIDDNDAVAARPSPKTRTGLARIFGKS
ncbi:MAG: Gfo/Idh/MocA family oxidoreductase [Novosphingobium sp.]|uniref:Gfo/Idh/MocA family protein n=1 Tax=Novosphingobium sp. TaxID=1874826 RepID=UPI003015A038